ncbi:hypothetical protein S40288_10853 [Stachybotrys chartarum IBT 40288]|nr:hypothetical protein S40288_10853 [Stachybotrys chartarum IBT 40288]
MAGSRGAAPRNQSEKVSWQGRCLGRGKTLGSPGLPPPYSRTATARKSEARCWTCRDHALSAAASFALPVDLPCFTGLEGCQFKDGFRQAFLAVGRWVMLFVGANRTTPPHHHTVKVQEVAEWMLCCSLPHGNISSLITATLLSGNPVAHGTPPALAEQLYLMKT